MNDYCKICGAIITSIESIQRGYGEECAKALRKAKTLRVFDNQKLKAEYYSLQARLLIRMISEKTFKSEFKKSFQKSVVKQQCWLSKKQTEICKDILFKYDRDALDSFEVELTGLHEDFWNSIEVTRDDIECARALIRSK